MASVTEIHNFTGLARHSVRSGISLRTVPPLRRTISAPITARNYARPATTSSDGSTTQNPSHESALAVPYPRTLKCMLLEGAIRTILAFQASFVCHKCFMIALAAKSLVHHRRNRNTQDDTPSTGGVDNSGTETGSYKYESEATQDSITPSSSSVPQAEQLRLQAVQQLRVQVAQLSLQAELLGKERDFYQETTHQLCQIERELQKGLTAGGLGSQFSNCGAYFDTATVQLESDRQLQQMRTEYSAKLLEYAQLLTPGALDHLSTNILQLHFTIKREEVRLCKLKIEHQQAIAEATCARVRLARLQQLPAQPLMSRTIYIVKNELEDDLAIRTAELEHRISNLRACRSG